MVSFRKMQGLGNDFAVFDARNEGIAITSDLARRIADRHFGIGCDTVVVLLPGTAKADAYLRFFNADGGEIEACGNATRCVARLLMDERGLARVRLESMGGLQICNDAGKGLVAVDMGAPGLDWREFHLAEPQDTHKFQFPVKVGTVNASAVSMGSP